MQQIPIVTSSCVVPPQQFWKSILLYHNKPHIVNRKVAGIVQLYLYEFRSDKIKQPKDIFSYAGILYEVRKLDSLHKDAVTSDFIRNFIEPYDKKFKCVETTLDQLEKQFNGVFISVRILLSRIKPYEKSVEIVLLDKNENSVTFWAVSKERKHSIAPSFVYSIELDQTGHLRIMLNTIEDCETNSAEWLCDHVFSKLLSWCEDYEYKSSLGSLTLVNVESYYNFYHTLKVKYSDVVMQMWCEKTDPKKFIHEDIAIAAYLMSIWQKSQGGKPSFVDLGCGNGLLVYILIQEGYQGLGVDIRKRKIWDVYPKNVNLEVRTISDPSSTIFPNTDWIIGNHSDELTPWIPVIAFNSSIRTNYFVLPCCPFDFNGQKYRRLDTSKSQYSEYLEYLQHISKIAGFDTKVDKLRIPSTKRQCIIGLRMKTSIDENKELETKLISYIASRSNDVLEKGIKIRPEVERVRNCTQLNRELINRLVKQIVMLLLKNDNCVTKDNGEKWNAGRSMRLKDLPQHLSTDDLQQLKKECGGLKTLIKNHRYIFQVQADEIRIRTPMMLKETEKYKEKPCWFLNNHPDGCFYNSTVCAYKHVE